LLLPENLSTSAKVLNWINAQQANAKTEQHKSKYESLKNNIDVNELWVEDIREGDKIILIPVKDGFEIKNNKNKPVTNYLFLIQDTKGEIQLGEILQYLAEDKTHKTSLPRNVLHKLYTFESVSGQFTNIDILNTDYYLTETEYRNNKLYRNSVVQPKPKNTDATLPPGDGVTGCTTTDWYQWTLITYEDGTTEYSEIFLFSSTVCPPSGGGDGSNGNGSGGLSTDEDDAPYVRSASLVWRVGHGTVGNNYWRVLSTENLKGIKPRNSSLKATFTSAERGGTTLDAPSSVATWVQGSNSANVMNDYKVTATNSGTVNFAGPYIPADINNLQNFISYEIWPN
jgi:hypothetical protein